MYQHAWMLCAASVMASTATASSHQPTRLYALEGEILVYSPAQSGLPLNTIVAPRGASSERELLLKVETLTSASDDLSTFTSSSLVHGTEPLLLGERAGSPLVVGDLSLVRDSEGWTFYAEGDEMRGRPVFTISPSSLSLNRISADQVAISGELVMHEAMEAELGLQNLILPPTRVVGAVTLVATSSAGVAPAAPTVSTTWQSTATSLGLTSVVGPDVIVSTVGTPIAKNGTVGTITAFSVQTVSCNIGTTDAIWIDCTTGANCNQHPVIGSQYYRLKTVAGSTRFEQIGMSWLKHGFCAADAPNCGTPYVSNASCDWLGLFATDTYGSGLNGTQSNLGPRSEIQPWTGVYPYPYILQAGLSGNAIYKRGQIENNDLDPGMNSGAQYLCEVVYICTDEPDANKYNNYSNRVMTVSGGAGSGVYTATLGATTNTQQSAVQRWPLMDSGVTLVNVDTPGDGRFVVGAKATDLGGGIWHYEYAVFNMNNHDSAREIKIPADASVAVTNIGFHDVFYHSGEPYDGTDWAGAQAGGFVSWSTSTFAANANANALRWSTTYNFRFDANVPPVTGDMNIGLFRSGGNAVASGLPVPGTNGFAFCAGDGTGTACPCANNSTVGANEGCLNSLGTGGKLTTSGTPSLSNDSLLLSAAGMPNGPCLYFQGTTQLAGGLGATFGDGLRCAGGTVIRLAIKTNTAGASFYPAITDPSVSVKGGLVGAGSVNYQVWYRDSAAFCSASTFNLTNGFQIPWLP